MSGGVYDISAKANKPQDDTPSPRATWRDLGFSVVGLLALLGFSMWNQLNYLLATWTPDNGMGLPTLVAYLVRACAAPVFFLFAALMAPQVESIGYMEHPGER